MRNQGRGTSLPLKVNGLESMSSERDPSVPNRYRGVARAPHFVLQSEQATCERHHCCPPHL
eukprot:3290636-Amphidinium_carterae.1